MVSTTGHAGSPTRNRTNGLYGPTARGHYYKPLRYHGRSAQPRAGKSRWCIKEGEQYLVFRPASEGDWSSERCAGLFGIMRNGSVVLGSEGQRLAFFPEPTNKTDPWHGYPATCADRQPGTDLIDRWASSGIITEHVRRKLEGGRL